MANKKAEKTEAEVKGFTASYSVEDVKTLKLDKLEANSDKRAELRKQLKLPERVKQTKLQLLRDKYKLPAKATWRDVAMVKGKEE